MDLSLSFIIYLRMHPKDSSHFFFLFGLPLWYWFKWHWSDLTCSTIHLNSNSIFVVLASVAGQSVGLLRVGSGGAAESARAVGQRPMLRRYRKRSSGQCEHLPTRVRHSFPVVPQGVSKQRDRFQSVHLRQRVQPRLGWQFVHLRRAGQVQRQTRHTFLLPLAGKSPPSFYLIRNK